jgi:hypothetical protein
LMFLDSNETSISCMAREKGDGAIAGEPDRGV